MAAQAGTSGIKTILNLLKKTDASHEVLVEAIGPHVKRGKNSKETESSLHDLIEMMEKRDHATLWKAVERHVGTIVAELQEAGDDVGFDPVGKQVEKNMASEDGTEILDEAGETTTVQGRIVEVLEDEGEVLCAVAYEDGSTELFPFMEARDRIVVAGDSNGAGGGRDEDDDLDEDGSGAGTLSSEGVAALSAVALFAHAWVTHRGKSGLVRVECPSSMVATMAMLHDALFSFSGLQGVACQEAIARACEAWWVDERPGAELLVCNLLPYLMASALGDEAKEVDVRRLYAIRGSLVLLDFEDESTQGLVGLLLRCAFSPRFLDAKNNGGGGGSASNSEGRKFLVFLFSLHPTLVDGLHHTIKNQLPLASSRVHRIYGDLYLKAWVAAAASSSSSGSSSSSKGGKGGKVDKTAEVYRRAVEACVQDLMHVSVHAASPRTHAALRAVLAPMHEAKTTPTNSSGGGAANPGGGGAGVEGMLCRLWEPIIWRALKVANPQVRCQSLAMLTDAFPLNGVEPLSVGEGPVGAGSQASSVELGLVDNGELLQRQFDAVRSALADEVPKVRCEAIRAVSHVLSNFWEALPADVSKTLLRVVAESLATDRASPHVRCASVDAFTQLLDLQPLSHGALKALLPVAVKHSVHDTDARVRLSVCKLLQRVSTVRGIRFFDVVPVDHLMARLAADHAKGNAPCLAVSSAITRLLAPSYFPASVSVAAAASEEGESAADAAREKELLKRCVSFLKGAPSAALSFYSTAHEFVDLASLTRLVVTLVSYAHNAASATIEAEQKQQQGDDNDDNGEDEEENGDHDEEGAADDTPDERSKRKRKSAKAAKAKAAAAAASGAVAAGGGNKAGGKAVSGMVEAAADSALRRDLVALVLQCAAVLWESLLPTLRGEKGGGSQHANTTKAARAEAAAQGEDLAGRVGGDGSLPQLYELLLLNGSSGDGGGGALWSGARAQVLRLAACMHRDDVPALGPLLLQGMQTSSQGASGAEDGGSPDFALTVALLCKWGSAGEVVGMVAESLEAHFNPTTSARDDDGSGDDGGADGTDDDVRSKRKRAPPNKSKRAAAAAAAEKASEQPKSRPMPLALALQLLDFVLEGKCQLGSEARAIILQDQGALPVLVGALSGVKRACLTAMGQPASVAADEVEEGVVPTALLVEAVTVYGRLLLHECASGDDDDEAPSSRGMAELLHWCADSVLPVALLLAPPSSAAGTAAAVDTKGADASLFALVSSPPAKHSRPSGTTPAKLKKSPPPSSSLSPPAPPSVSSREEEEATTCRESVELATAVASAVVTLAGDWAACGLACLPELTSFTEAASKAVLRAATAASTSSSGPGDSEEMLRLPSPASMSPLPWCESEDVVVGPLCLLAYRLALQESHSSKRASIPPSALSLLLRGAHLFHGNGDAGGEDEKEEGAGKGGSKQAFAGAGKRGFTPERSLHLLLLLAHKRGARNHTLFVRHISDFLLRQQPSVTATPEQGAGECAVAAAHALSRSAVLSTVLAHKPSAKLLVSELAAKATEVPAPPPLANGASSPLLLASSSLKTSATASNKDSQGEENDENSLEKVTATSPNQRGSKKKKQNSKRGGTAASPGVVAAEVPVCSDEEALWLGDPAVVLLRACLIRTNSAATAAAAGGKGVFGKNRSAELAEWVQSEALAAFGTTAPTGAKIFSPPFSSTNNNRPGASTPRSVPSDPRRVLLRVGIP